MKKSLAAIVAALASLILVACGVTDKLPGGSGENKDDFGSEPLTIVTATELDILRPALDRAQNELGFEIVTDSPDGTIANSKELKAGSFDGRYDATWFATNRYAQISGADNKQAEATSVATSPVVLGVRSYVAQSLGWADKQPTWAEIEKAITNGDLDFGMTDPATSNSGFSALASVATAMADTGEALSTADIHRVHPRLQKIFEKQSLTSGSSGWLAKRFAESPTSGNALFNYESVLRGLAEDGMDITVVVPQDGVISADYPLTVLKDPATPQAKAKVDALVKWFADHPDELTNVGMRPVQGNAVLPEDMASTTLFELPFPASEDVVTTLRDSYYNELRSPGTTAFVLDTSGSMKGERLDSLESTMNDLISSDDPAIAFRDRETVSVQPFARDPQEPTTVTIGEQGASEQLNGAVSGLVADGETAVFSALHKAYDDIDAGDDSISSVLLLSDGEQNMGITYDEFAEIYHSMPPEKQDIPVFVILYGEANSQEMGQLAEMTGGKVFDALNGDLHAAFTEIRAYQ